MNTQNFIQMFIATLFIIGRNWKKTKKQKNKTGVYGLMSEKYTVAQPHSGHHPEVKGLTSDTMVH